MPCAQMTEMSVCVIMSPMKLGILSLSFKEQVFLNYGRCAVMASIVADVAYKQYIYIYKTIRKPMNDKGPHVHKSHPRLVGSLTLGISQSSAFLDGDHGQYYVTKYSVQM